jgi:hypothetical protein
MLWLAVDEVSEHRSVVPGRCRLMKIRCLFGDIDGGARHEPVERGRAARALRPEIVEGSKGTGSGSCS